MMMMMMMMMMDACFGFDTCEPCDVANQLMTHVL